MLGGSRPIAALIGPFCSAACESTAFLANARNIAQISPACSSPSLSNQEQFSTFVRTTGSYAKLADPILALLQQMSWTRLSILADTSNIMQMSAGSLIDKLGADKLGAVVQFVAGRFEDALLARIQRSSVRIVMVYAYTTDYVAIAEAAWKRQMLVGWAWLAIAT
jgi:ABC-type branched-subunit amino acid transport system substrate-binding protein